MAPTISGNVPESKPRRPARDFSPGPATALLIPSSGTRLLPQPLSRGTRAPHPGRSAQEQVLYFPARLSHTPRMRLSPDGGVGILGSLPAGQEPRPPGRGA